MLAPQEKVKGIGPHAITRPQNTRGPTDQLSSLGKRKDLQLDGKPNGKTAGDWVGGPRRTEPRTTKIGETGN